MVRGWVFALLAGLTSVPSAPAQTWQFAWKPGQVLAYRLERTTSESSVVEENKINTSSRLSLVKSWKVVAVDQAGIATLEYALTSFRMERTTPGGEVLLFDSADPDKSNQQMREQLSKYVGQTLAVLRVDGRGKVVEVKECKFFPASRYESELPFHIALPEPAPQAGQAWERNYSVTLEPPQGTGEKYQATQKYSLQAVENGFATIAMATVMNTLPMAVADQVPLLEMQPEGTVVFDTNAGVLQSARLKIDKELKNHMGEGSSYHFEATSVEELIR